MVFGCFYIDDEGNVWALFPNGEWRVIVRMETEPRTHLPRKSDASDKEEHKKDDAKKGGKKWVH